jgi:hypothetical protein
LVIGNATYVLAYGEEADYQDAYARIAGSIISTAILIVMIAVAYLAARFGPAIGAAIRNLLRRFGIELPKFGPRPKELPKIEPPKTIEELVPRLSPKAQEAFTQQKALLPERAFKEMQNAFRNPDGTFDVARANNLFEKKWMPPEEFQKKLAQVKPEFPRSWDDFVPENHAEFKAELNTFRGDENLEPPRGFRGGEGQLFLSEKQPLLALKRWFKSRLADMGESIRLLRGAKDAVDANPKLRADVEVAKVHKQGSDWVLRDFDPDSVPLRRALSDADASAARARAIAELEGTTDPLLQDILKKLQRNSDNVHWSPSKKKIVIIDMK